MAQISVTIIDVDFLRVIDGMCGQFGYQKKVKKTVEGTNEIIEIDNPETKEVFVRRMIAGVIKESVKSWEVKKASEQARLSVIDEVNKLDIQ